MFMDAIEVDSEGEIFGPMTETVRTSNRTEFFDWLGDFATVTRWDGERELSDFKSFGFSVEPEHYEISLKVDANDLADERLSMYTRRIRQRVNAFANHRRQLLMERLSNAWSRNSYDGVSFISSSHPLYEPQGDSEDSFVQQSTQSNIVTDGSTANFKLARNYKTALAIDEKVLVDMRTLRGTTGERISVNPDTVIVPESQRSVADEVFNADELLDTSANEMRPNPLQRDYEIVADDELDRQGFTDGFFLVDTSNPVLMPMIYLIRQGVQVDSLLEDSEHAIKNNSFVYGADARYNVAFGHWQAVFASDGSGGTL
jgi:phage major head subunit gpT-like protein